jgi:isocitrate dehydrogenase
LMLVHVGLPDAAAAIHNGWLKTIEDGIHTYDIFDEKISKKKVGTTEFANAVIERLGQLPHTLKAVHYEKPHQLPKAATRTPSSEKKALVGVDVFVDSTQSVEELYSKLAAISVSPFKLTMIANRGVKVWPEKIKETFCIDSWRLRFMPQNGVTTHHAIAELLLKLADAKVDFVKTEQLCTFDGKPGYTVAQDEQ